MTVPDTPRRRSALQFALDVTGGRDVVYRVAVYLQDLVARLEQAPGVVTRTRVELLLLDDQQAQVVTREQLLDTATRLATGHAPTGIRLRPLIDELGVLPYEGGGFHTFILLTRTPVPDWLRDLPALHQLVGSVTGLCCGPECSPAAAMHLSKEPGGMRVVNPLDTIRAQFDSIASWLLDNFADKPVYPEVIPMSEPPPEPIPDPEPITPITPGKWRVIEPSDPTDATTHTAATRQNGAPGWNMVAASRRGKLHAHEGTYRDDAFALGAHNGWNLIAVADGAGSCRLSRVGAREATVAAISGMQDGVNRYWPQHAPEQGDDLLRQIVIAGFEAAQSAVFTEAGRRGIPVRDLSSTLLLLAHHPGSKYLIVGQIGDGALLAVYPGQEIQELGKAGAGFYSGETIFLPSIPAQEWNAHAWVYGLSVAPDMLLVMTDGVGDDFIPYQRQIPMLLGALRDVLKPFDPAPGVLDLLGYDKRDSADDRTLAVLYPTEKQA